MAGVLAFIIVAVIFVIAYTFVSTFVVPILALYVLLNGWEKSGAPIRTFVIAISSISIAILLFGSAMDGDLLSNLDFTTLSPFLSLLLVGIAYSGRK